MLTAILMWIGFMGGFCFGLFWAGSHEDRVYTPEIYIPREGQPPNKYCKHKMLTKLKDKLFFCSVCRELVVEKENEKLEFYMEITELSEEEKRKINGDRG